MKKPQFSRSPFSRLNLTHENQQLLQELSISTVEENFYRYEEFVTESRGRVDEQTWKLARTKDNLRLYVERIVPEESEFDGRQRTKSVERMQPWSTSRGLPVMLSVGTVFGQLEDLMLGITNPSHNIQRVTTSYSDELDDAAVLYPLVEPTADDPFRSVMIKWIETDIPLNATTVVKNRDYIVMEATGMLEFGNGERVGYHLLHSIDFPETHPLYHRIRGNMSLCSFYRQMNKSQIDCFTTGTLDAGGELMEFLLLPVAASVIFSPSSNVYCGEMKKLSWLLQKKQALGGHGWIRQGNTCVSCATKASAGSLLRIGRSTCKLCFGCVCHSCKVRKKVSFITTDQRLVRRKITFCALCINDTVKMSAMEAAHDQAQGYDAYNVVHFDSGSQCSSETSLYE